jgi:predicted SnoaL-like aldol condensation-catalyzing enzyme
LKEEEAVQDGELKVYIADALGQVCFGDEEQFPLLETIDRYFAPGYRQCTDGEEIDRAGFVEHMRALRRRVASGQVEVIEAVREGNHVADRHRVEVTKPDGGTVTMEVYLFGDLDDTGRLVRVDEVSRMLSGGSDDVDLASAR